MTNIRSEAYGVKCVLALVAIVALCCSDIANANALRISQVYDTGTDVYVFVRDADTKQNLLNKERKLDAALGSQPLTVKEIRPWFKVEPAIALVVAIDVSASLGKQEFAAIQKSVIDFLQRLPSGSQIAIATVGSEFKLVQGFSSDIIGISKLISDLSAIDQETSLYEAILKSQQLAQSNIKGLPKRRAVLVVTDGLDDSHRGYGQSELIRQIAERDAPVFSIGITKNPKSSKQDDALKTLADISRTSGGEYVQVLNTTIPEALTTLTPYIQDVFAVILDCSKCIRDGKMQRLQLAATDRTATATATATDSRDIRLLSEGFSTLPVQPSEAQVKGAAPNPDETWMTKIRALFDQYPIEGWVLICCVTLLLGIGIRSIVLAVKNKKAQRGLANPIDPIWNDLNLPNRGGAHFDSSSSAGLAEPSLTIVPNASGGRKIVLAVAGDGKQVFTLSPEVSFGRSSSNTLVLPEDSLISSRHGAIIERNGIPIVVDHGSTNGTYLNGARIVNPEPLSDGDLLLVGSTEIRVYLTD